MLHNRIVGGFFALVMVLTLTLSPGCRPKKKPAPPQALDYSQALPPGQLALRKLSPGEYPNFAVVKSDLVDLDKAVDNSLRYMTAPSSRQFYPYSDITHDRAVATLHAFRQLVTDEMAAAADDGTRINAAIRERFEVYQSIGAMHPDGFEYTGKVLFTGYFTPIYPASFARGGAYQWPLYKRPADLVSDEATGKVQGRRMPDGQVVPYYTRAEIEGGNLLAGQELCYMTSRWDAYVVTIQGSARLRLPNGQIKEIGYAGNNGHEYVSPADRMVQDGVITREQHSLRGLATYFRNNTAAMDRYLSLNPRYVFFTERPGGPFGSLNVPVTSFRSIATDKSVYPRAMPTFLTVPIPVGESGATRPFRGFMLDQDTGGAIRAAGRCDIYMGVGEIAERIAGHEQHEGQLYYLAIKPQYVRQYSAGR